MNLKERRQGREWMAVMIAVAMALGLAQSQPPGPPETGFVMVLACAWMLHVVVIPTLVRPVDTVLLTTLQRGRCLPDLAGSSLTPRQMVDTLGLRALGTLPSLAAAGFGFYLALLILPDGIGRGEVRFLAVALSLALFPVLRVCGSYSAQMLAAWTGESERVSLPQLGLSLLAHGPANVLLVMGGFHAWEGDPMAGIMEGLVGMLWLALVSRGAAILGLERREAAGWEAPRGVHRAGLRPRMPSWLNPVTSRELLRDLTLLPGGAATLVALNLLMLPVLGVWLEAGAAPAAGEPPSPGALVGVPLAVLLVLGCLRASSRTLDACFAERDGRTLDLLRTTLLSPAEWLDGVALLGWLPRALETALALVLLAAVWAMYGIPVGPPLLLGLAVLAALPLASYLGTLCFSDGGERRSSVVTAHFVLLGGLWLLVTAAALADATSSPVAAGLLFLGALQAAALVRSMARANRSLAEGPDLNLASGSPGYLVHTPESAS